MDVSARKWRTLRDELVAEGKIDVLPDGRLSNFRYRKERENALNLSRKRAESGASGGHKSGEVRKNANENNGGDEASASVLPLYARAIEAEAESDKKKEVEDRAASAGTVESAVDALTIAATVGRAAGVAIFPNRAKHFADQLDVIREWLAMGLDPDTEIIPALQQRVLDKPAERHSLAYFTPMMADVAARKEAKANGHTRNSGSPTRSNDGFINAIREAGDLRRSRQPQ
jgi:hypothetical protein